MTTKNKPIPLALIDGNLADPIMIDSKDLMNFLEHAGIKMPEVLMESAHIADTKVSCEAFYYTTNGPLLIMFELAFRDKEGKAGFIKRLTGVKALGELFDVQGAFVRLFRCPRESFPSLRQYCARLAA